MAKSAPQTAPKTLNDLLELVEKSGLFSPAQLTEVRELVRASGDSERALIRLVAKNHLTAWQADQVRGGQFVLKLGDYRLLQENETWDFGRVFLAAHAGTGQRVS